MFAKSKVKFQDQQMDDYVLEISVLQSKLQSKIEALTIMSKELDKCHMERDRYRVLVDQIKNKNVVPTLDFYNINMYKQSHHNSMSAGDMLAKTREQNSLLRLEVESLRSKLEDALGDVNALRKQLHLFESKALKSTIFGESNKNYEELVLQLETIHKKYQQLQMDYRATLDEKEELVSDRDYYKTKVMRLNHQISFQLNTRSKSQEIAPDSPKPLVDIDSILTENKYLQERVTQLQVEKEIVTRNLNKYKNLLEHKNKNDTHNKKNFADIMTQKQVREFFETNSKSGLKRSSAAELKSLCMSLFESLNDKSVALQHQRKTNQILANRITELEKTLESWCNGERYVPIFPSQMLLDDILPDCEPPKCDDIEIKEEPQEFPDNHEMQNDSDDDKNISDSSTEMKNNKIVLPYELEELVKEALAELKTIN